MAGEGTSLRELLATFGFRIDSAPLAAMDRSVESAIGTVTRLGQLLVSGAVVHGVASFMQRAIDAGSELHDMSEQTGLSATELTEWRYAARLAGVEASALSTAMARAAVVAVRQPSAFRRLGVATHDANGELRRTSDLFEDAGAAIGALTNDTERTAAATALFGRQGRALLPMFRQGRAGIAGLRAEVRRLYGTDLERLSELSDRAGDSQDRFSLALDALSTRLAVNVLPWLTSFLETSGELASQFVTMVQASNAVTGALVAIGAVAAAVALATIELWGPPVLIFGLIALALVGVALAVDDVLTAIQGGRSVIGSFIDDLFGAGTTASLVAEGAREIKAAMEAISPVVAALGEAFRTGLAMRIREVRGEVRQVAAAIESAYMLMQRAVIAAGEAGQALGVDTGIDVAGRRASLDAERAAFGARVGTPGYLAGASGAELSAIASHQGSVAISRNVNGVVIHIDGSGDPAATGRAVRDAIEQVGDEDVDASAHDLIPAGAP